MSFYYILLMAHSGLRWLVLLAATIAVVRSLIGLFSNGKYSKFDNIIGAIFTGFMHLQVLLGIILYFISPIVQSARNAGMSAMMGDKDLRFWGMEHAVMMILAAVATQIGRSKSKKSLLDKSKYKFQAIFFTLSLILIFLAIPWERI